MAVQNFKLVSEFQTIQRRPFALHDSAILDPLNANPLLDGEFLELNSSYAMVRGSATPAMVPSFAYFAERGRYEVQAIQKGPFLFLGPYEADTLIMTSTSLVVGSALEVSNVTYGALTRRGLVLHTSGVPVGYVTRLPTNNHNFLRFVRAYG
jgi:hypothetical protein